MISVTVSNLVKRYEKMTAVDSISFEAKAGELTTLLGPSGCGKTTTLRCIAGLENPDGGEISVGDRVVASDSVLVDTNKRNLAMVFQSYAIWPHMNVFNNVAYGLKVKRLPRNEIKEKVKNALSLVRLEGIEDKHPSKLSGGQQQRVALARSLVVEPQVLLLDEPLSNLDLKLREQMRIELKEIQRKLGVTSIYVTHDQTEALSMSDSIVIMNNGKIAQIGSPKEIYANPDNQFVAKFIGQTNILEGKVKQKTGDAGTVELFNGTEITCNLPASVKEGANLTLSTRPEEIEILPKKQKTQNILEGTFLYEVFLGDTSIYQIDVAGKQITVQMIQHVNFEEKQKVWLKPNRFTYVFG